MPPAGEKFINADTRMVSGDYFQAMEIPLLEGRLFNDHDVPANPGVAIVDDYMARAALARPGRRRQALSHRRHRRHQGAVDHRRRRGRPGEAVHAGFRLAHRLLSAAHAVSDASHERRGAQQRRSRRAGGSSQAADSRDRQRSAALQRGDHGASRGLVAGAAALCHAAAGLLRLHLAGAGGDRHLRRAGLPGQPGHARDRHPHGPGGDRAQFSAWSWARELCSR